MPRYLFKCVCSFLARSDLEFYDGWLMVPFQQLSRFPFHSPIAPIAAALVPIHQALAPPMLQYDGCDRHVPLILDRCFPYRLQNTCELSCCFLHSLSNFLDLARDAPTAPASVRLVREMMRPQLVFRKHHKDNENFRVNPDSLSTSSPPHSSQQPLPHEYKHCLC